MERSRQLVRDLYARQQRVLVQSATITGRLAVFSAFETLNAAPLMQWYDVRLSCSNAHLLSRLLPLHTTWSCLTPTVTPIFVECGPAVA